MTNSTNFTQCYNDLLAQENTAPPGYDYDPYCQCYQASAIEAYSSDKMNAIFVLLFLMSVAGLAFVSITIFYDKRLQAHPQPLIAYICVAEALMSWNALLQVLNPVYISCYFGLDQILSWTLFNFNPTISQLWNSLNALCWSNSMSFIFFQICSLMLNLCLCLDLILTMFSPFKPASSRVKWYLCFSCFMPFLFVLQIYFEHIIVDANCID